MNGQIPVGYISAVKQLMDRHRRERAAVTAELDERHQREHDELRRRFFPRPQLRSINQQRGSQQCEQ